MNNYSENDETNVSASFVSAATSIMSPTPNNFTRNHVAASSPLVLVTPVPNQQTDDDNNNSNNNCMSERHRTPPINLILSRKRMNFFTSSLSQLQQNHHSLMPSSAQEQQQQQQRHQNSNNNNTISLGQQLADCRRNTFREAIRVDTPSWVGAVDDVATGGYQQQQNGQKIKNIFSSSSPSTGSANDYYNNNNTNSSAGEYFETYGSMFKQSKIALEQHLQREQDAFLDQNESGKCVKFSPSTTMTPSSNNNNNSNSNMISYSSPSTSKQNTVVPPRTFSESLLRDHQFREEEVRKRFFAKARGFTPVAFQYKNRENNFSSASISQTPEPVHRSSFNNNNNLSPFQQKNQASGDTSSLPSQQRPPRSRSSLSIGAHDNDNTIHNASATLPLLLSFDSTNETNININNNFTSSPPPLIHSTKSSSSSVVWQTDAMEREDLRDLRRRKSSVGAGSSMMSPNFQRQQQQLYDLSELQGFHTQQEIAAATSPFGTKRQNNVDVSSNPEMQQLMRGILVTAEQRQQQKTQDEQERQRLQKYPHARRELSSGGLRVGGDDRAAEGGGFTAGPNAFTNNSFHASGNLSMHLLSNNSSFASLPNHLKKARSESSSRVINDDRKLQNNRHTSVAYEIGERIDHDLPSLRRQSDDEDEDDDENETSAALTRKQVSSRTNKSAEEIENQIHNEHHRDKLTQQLSKFAFQQENFSHHSEGDDDDDDGDDEENKNRSYKEIQQKVEHDEDEAQEERETNLTYLLNPELKNLPSFDVLLQRYINCREMCRKRGVSFVPTVNSYDPLRPTKASLISPALCESSGRAVDPPLHTAAAALSRFVTDESIVDAPSRVSGEGESVMREVETEIAKWFRPWRHEFQDARTIRNSDIISAMPVSSLRDLKAQREMARRIREGNNISQHAGGGVGANKKRSRISKKDLILQQQQLVQKMQRQSSSASASEEAKEAAKERSRKTMTLMFDPMCGVLRDLWNHFHVPFVDRAQFEDWNMRSVSRLNMWVISREISLYLGVKGSATDTLMRLINTRKSIVDRLVTIARHPVFASAERGWHALDEEYAASMRGDRSPPRLNNRSNKSQFGIDDPIELETLGLEFLALVLAGRRITTQVVDALILSNSMPYSGPRIKLRDLEDQYLWSMRSDLIKEIGDTPLLRLLSLPHPLEKKKKKEKRKNNGKGEKEECNQGEKDDDDEGEGSLLEKQKRQQDQNKSYWDRVVDATIGLFKGKQVPLSHDNVFMLPHLAHKESTHNAHETVRAHIDKKHRELRAHMRRQEMRKLNHQNENGSAPSSPSHHQHGSFASATSYHSAGSGNNTVVGLNLQEIQKQYHVLQQKNHEKGKNNHNDDIHGGNKSSTEMQQNESSVVGELDLELLEKANILVGGDKRNLNPIPNSVQLSSIQTGIPNRKPTKESLNASRGHHQPLFAGQQPRGFTTKNQQVTCQTPSANAGGLKKKKNNNNNDDNRNALSSSHNNNNNIKFGENDHDHNASGGKSLSTYRVAGEGVEISIRAVQKIELDQAKNADVLENLEREKELSIEAILRSQVPDFLAKTETCRLVVIKNGESGLRQEFLVEVPVKVSRDRKNLSRRQLQLYANVTKQVADTLASHPTFQIQWVTSEQESILTQLPRRAYFDMLERNRIQNERHQQRVLRSKRTMVISGGEAVDVPPYEYPEEVLASSGKDNTKPPEVEALSRLSPLEEFVLRLRRSLDPEILRKTLVIRDTDTCDAKVRAILNVSLPPSFYQYSSEKNHHSSKNKHDETDSGDSSNNNNKDGNSIEQLELLSRNQTKSEREGLTNARAKRHPEEIAGFIESPVFEFTKDARNMTFRPIASEAVLSLRDLQSSLEKFASLCRERLLRAACKKVARGCKRKLQTGVDAATGTIFGSFSDILKRDRLEKERALAAAQDDDGGEEGFIEWLVQHGTVDPWKASNLRDAFSNSWDEAARYCRDHGIASDDTEAEKTIFLNTLLSNLQKQQHHQSGNSNNHHHSISEREEQNEMDEIWRNPVVRGAQAELLSKEQLTRRVVAHDAEAMASWPRHLGSSKKGDTFLFK